MIPLNITLDESQGFTLLSNAFIDLYMKDANDSQIKIYLYLLRMVSANLPTNISEIADKFNDTEKDVIRSLKYWEKQHLLHIDYDAFDNIVGIHFANPGFSNTKVLTANYTTPVINNNENRVRSNMEYSNNSDSNVITEDHHIVNDINNKPTDSFKEQPSSTSNILVSKSAKRKVTIMTMDYEKAKEAYSINDIKTISSDPNVKMLLIVAERYFERPLNPDELKSLLFIYDRLAFSFELIDYLLQYCIDQGQKSIRYIEQIAYGWYESGVTTEKQAKSTVHKQENSAYAIMSYLGKSGIPTDTELAFIRRWTHTYDFSLAIIEDACSRTVLATDHHRFEYAESILKSWHDNGVRTKEDINRLDKAFADSKQAKENAKELAKAGQNATYNNKSQSSGSNSMTKIESHDYDFSALEKALTKVSN